MALYAIGDIQGCYEPLQRLLEQLRFDPATDRLWFAGDLVNRGPQSLETLRFVKGLGARAVTVLGNHDLHLLAVWQNRDHLKAGDTLTPLLEAPDCEELMEWLRRRPLMHYDAAIGRALVHAGLAPQWDIATALACAGDVEAVLAGPDFDRFLKNMYGNRPDRWDPDLTGWDRLRFAVNCFTRLRFCTEEGRLEFGQKGRPGEQAAGFVPWFRVPGRRSMDTPVVFGHWSTLGLHLDDNVLALDTGCLWGGALTAVRLDHPDPTVSQVACPATRRPE